MTKDNPLNLPLYANGVGRFITDKKGYLLAQCSDKEIAAYIVRCCNMHHELIAVLERLAGDDTEAKLLLERAKHD